MDINLVVPPFGTPLEYVNTPQGIIGNTSTKTTIAMINQNHHFL